MIYVKEVGIIRIYYFQTRHKIVAKYPTMKALDVMKEVGKGWKNMSENERQYF